MKKITVSKREYVDMCVWACRHGLNSSLVYVDMDDGFVFLERSLSHFGPNFVDIGNADVSEYCDDVESESAADQIIAFLDMNDYWSLATYRENPRSPMLDLITFDWID